VLYVKRLPLRRHLFAQSLPATLPARQLQNETHVAAAITIYTLATALEPRQSRMPVPLEPVPLAAVPFTASPLAARSTTLCAVGG
jgi:hypothetical protein